MGQAKDEKRNGELISKGENSDVSGSVVGVVLYDEGLILLTSSANITEGITQDCYTGDSSNLENPKWIYYSSYNASPTAPSSSLFTLNFRGTTQTPVMTLFANAMAGATNNSQNSTWVSSSAGDWREKQIYFDSGTFAEPPQLQIANTIESQYEGYKEKFEKQVFISQVGIYDDQKNLIAVAKMATPVLKKESDSITFKLKLDM